MEKPPAVEASANAATVSFCVLPEVIVKAMLRRRQIQCGWSLLLAFPDARYLQCRAGGLSRSMFF
jgi:hypothetical protein